MPSVFESIMADNLKGAIFPALATTATYTPASGSAADAIPVRVQRGGAHEESRNGVVVEIQSATIHVLQSVLHPTKGGRFTIENGTEVWTIDLVPVLKNGEFTCTCSRAAAGTMPRRAGNA